jgi:DNA-directed RNA polymerase sigma subunit (sigma70/sigma32)
MINDELQMSNDKWEMSGEALKREAVVGNGEIMIPALIIKQIGKVHKKTQELAGELGREPTDKEIAERMGWPITRVKGLKKLQMTNGAKKKGK